jgi:hypothetical protein
MTVPLGNALRWSQNSAKLWDNMTDEEKQIFIEMATPTTEEQEIAKSATVAQLQPFLNATLKENEVIIASPTQQ